MGCTGAKQNQIATEPQKVYPKSTTNQSKQNHPWHESHDKHNQSQYSRVESEWNTTNTRVISEGNTTVKLGNQ